jgi:hypothetical protein
MLVIIVLLLSVIALQFKPVHQVADWGSWCCPRDDPEQVTHAT